MSLKKQSTTKKEDIKLSILKAAKSLLIERGYKGASIRNIATKIGYSPTTIYLYYKDKNDIIYTLHQEGFELLGSSFLTLLNVEHPFERLKAIGKTYIQFLILHPGYYTIMFVMNEPMEFLNSKKGKGTWEEGKKILSLLIATIEECQTIGYFPNVAADAVALQAWSIVHGICSLHLSARLAKVGEECFDGEPSSILLNKCYDSYVELMEQLKK